MMADGTQTETETILEGSPEFNGDVQTEDDGKVADLAEIYFNGVEDDNPPGDETDSGDANAASEKEDGADDGDSRAEDKQTDGGADDNVPVATDDQLAHAEEAGFTRQDAEALAKAGQLDAVLGASDRRLASLAQQASAGKEGDEGGKEAAAPETPDPFSEWVKAERGKDDGYDGELLDRLDDLHKASMNNPAMAALREQVDAIQQGMQAEQNRQATALFDNDIEALGDTWQGTFGKGSIAEVQADKPALGNREKLYKTMQVLKSGYEAVGEQAPAQRELMRRALRLEFETETKRNVTRDVSNKMRDAKGQFASKPTRRTGRTSVAADDKARKDSELADWEKEHGIEDNEAPDNSLGGMMSHIPDR